ncbi:MAG: PEP-CTERM sorting domain-containing protein [Planctomycetaceae bacterium]|nr:PEP-CTERM sorting domain-containing protein [Planctomycetaceae bacterium]
MKKFVCLLVVMVLAAGANAGWINLDNFESYADSAALNSSWVVKTDGGVTPIIETLENDGDNYMKLYKNTTGNGAGYMQTRYLLPGGVWQNHGVNLTYLGITDIKFDSKVTDKACDYLQFSLVDCWGYAVTSTVNLPTSTGNVHDWATTDPINLASILIAGKNFENVYAISLTLKNTYSGVGDVLIDNVMVMVPEPATMSILALGGLLLRKRK